MTVEQAIEIIERKSSIPYENETFIEDIEPAYDMALSALRTLKERENQRPLILEELKQMLGEPIFIKRKYEAVGHWKILDSYGKCSITEETFNFSDEDFEFSKNYGRGWLAYRYPPKEEQR